MTWLFTCSTVLFVGSRFFVSTYLIDWYYRLELGQSVQQTFLMTHTETLPALCLKDTPKPISPASRVTSFKFTTLYPTNRRRKCAYDSRAQHESNEPRGCPDNSRIFPSFFARFSRQLFSRNPPPSSSDRTHVFLLLLCLRKSTSSRVLDETTQ